MANEMSTYVNVRSENPQVASKLQEIFKYREGQYEANAIDIINNIKGTDYSFSNETTKEDWNKEVDFPPNDLWDKMIGTKWLRAEYEHGNTPSDCNLVLRSAWNVPTSFLETLRDLLQEVDPDCYISGTYEDESYNPSGAFVYGKFNYEELEDTDEDYDWDEAEEDDFYAENWHESLNDMQSSLVTSYLDYVEDVENNPEEYE